MKICVITDDNSGILKNELPDENLIVLKMPIIIDGVTYFEYQNLTSEEFFKALKDGKDVKTSQPSPYDVENTFKEALKKYDEVIYIPMSSALSSTYETGCMISSGDEFKDKVFPVNNKRISVTLKQSVRDALLLIKKGYSGKEIKEKLEENGPNSHIYIMLNTMKYLKKGGRLTSAASLILDKLHLKPVLKIEGDKLDAYATAVIGTKKAKSIMINAVKKNIQSMLTKFNKEDLLIQMAYTQDLDEALRFKEEVEKEFGITNVEMNPLSLSIATHIGNGSLAITVSKIEK